MRILYLIGTLERGGAEGQLVQLACGLKARGHEIVVFTFHQKGAYHANTLRRSGIPVYTFDLPRLRPLYSTKGKLKVLRAFLTTLLFCYRFRPHILHPHLLESDYWMALCKVFLAPGKLVSSRLSLGIFKDSRPLKQTFQNYTNRITDLVICNAAAVMQDSFKREKYLKAEKTIVIRNGIEWQKVIETSPLPDEEFPVQLKGPLCLCVSNYHSYKGYQDLLVAWNLIIKKHPTAHLLCLGRDSGFLSELIKMGTELNLLDSVTFHDSVPNVTPWLKRADLFLYPSHQEGLPNAVLEALAADLPIIATNVGGVSEILEGHPNTQLVQPHQPDELARYAIEYLDSVPIPKRSEKLRSKLAHQWSLEQMIEKHEEAYNHLRRKN